VPRQVADPPAFPDDGDGIYVQKVREGFSKGRQRTERVTSIARIAITRYVSLSNNNRIYLSADFVFVFLFTKVIGAKTPQASIGFGGEDARIDSQFVSLAVNAWSPEYSWQASGG
jgi:hypothetical protein